MFIDRYNCYRYTTIFSLALLSKELCLSFYYLLLRLLHQCWAFVLQLLELIVQDIIFLALVQPLQLIVSFLLHFFDKSWLSLSCYSQEYKLLLCALIWFYQSWFWYFWGHWWAFYLRDYNFKIGILFSELFYIYRHVWLLLIKVDAISWIYFSFYSYFWQSSSFLTHFIISTLCTPTQLYYNLVTAFTVLPCELIIFFPSQTARPSSTPTSSWLSSHSYISSLPHMLFLISSPVYYSSHFSRKYIY